ncbi:hypothetical protein [Magnetospirillum sp. UT-4]|uniref:hypothetical protein n=1 Tax=Magnetospirillum sp. UT-4 TaxID=2681467 RepID=UPI0015729BEB|nr:hypothetical protein [Magnetospirillum sp. UT-4]
MERNHIIDAYYGDRLTAEDVTRGTGLSERSQRELLRLGILKPVPQAPTKQRLLSRPMFKRAAVIARLNSCGLSLSTAGQIAFFAPGSDALIDNDSFAEGIVLHNETDNDWLATIRIINNECVELDTGQPDPIEYCLLSENMTKLTRLLWRNAATGNYADARPTNNMLIQFDERDVIEADAASFKAARQNPVTTINVDITRSITVALRRLLSID